MPTTTKPSASRSAGSRRIVVKDRRREMQWIREHRNELAGQWVALEGDRVVASGTDARRVYELALRAGSSPPFLVHLDPAELLPTVGGW